MSDQEIVESAVKQAEEVLRAYIQPRQRRDCSQTMNRLLTILANNELIAALRRIDQAVQISATIDGSYVVESVSDCESAFVRANELLDDGVQDLQLVLPDGSVLIKDDLPQLFGRRCMP
ncbi:hypothetical protein ACSVBT_17380 [Afipia sp. TerB]